MKLDFSMSMGRKDRERFESAINHFDERFNAMSAQLDALVAQVQATNGVMASAVTLINGLATQLADVQAQLAAQGIDNTTLNDLKTALDQGDDALQALLGSGSPAPAPAEPPPADPVPVDTTEQPVDQPADPTTVDPADPVV